MKRTIKTAALVAIIDAAADMVVELGDASCVAIKLAVAAKYEPLGVDYRSRSKELIAAYQSVTGANIIHYGFKEYTFDEWLGMSYEEHTTIRLAKLAQFKQFILDNSWTITIAS